MMSASRISDLVKNKNSSEDNFAHIVWDLRGKKKFFFLVFLFFFRAIPMVYGGSQDRAPIRDVAASLHQSHSNVGSEPHLQPTSQPTATPDP